MIQYQGTVTDQKKLVFSNRACLPFLLVKHDLGMFQMDKQKEACQGVRSEAGQTAV